MYIAFLEAYIQRLEAPIAVQVWSTLFNLARDMSAAATTPPARVGLYPILRCLTALARIVASTSALEDRRLRRDLQEQYAKLIDNVMVNLSKVSEFEVWERSESDSEKRDTHAHEKVSTTMNRAYPDEPLCGNRPAPLPPFSARRERSHCSGVLFNCQRHHIARGAQQPVSATLRCILTPVSVNQRSTS